MENVLRTICRQCGNLIKMNSKGRGECIVRISVEGNVAKRLKAAPGRKNSAAGIVMCAMESGGRKIRKKL